MKANTFGVLAAMALAGCGGSSFTEGGPDATADSAGDDGSHGDAMGDTAPFDAVVDAVDGGGGDVILPDGACGCMPYWCGCGQCNPSQIACTANPPPCGLGCASGCPELQQVTCTCQDGRCVRGGIDAGGIGCVVDQDCPPGDCCAHVGPVGPGHLGQCKPNGDMCCGAGCP
jgi:hypothetical protein